MVEETGAEPRLVKEMEDFGIVKGEVRGGTTYYDETEREIVRAVTELARYGVAGRNLRVFKTSAEREAALLQQILAPSLRSRNPERRKEAIEALENLAAVASHLKHLLLVRDLRRIAKDRSLRHIRDIPDFPKPGILFKDITPLLLDAEALSDAVGELADWARPLEVESWSPPRRAGSSRRDRARAGRRLRAGAQARQAAARDDRAEYILEYGVDALEMHADALADGARVLLHDDLLATGGTARALAELIEGTGARIAGCAFLVELAFLGGRTGSRATTCTRCSATTSDRRPLPHAARGARGGVEADRRPRALARWWPRVERVKGVTGRAGRRSCARRAAAPCGRTGGSTGRRRAGRGRGRRRSTARRSRRCWRSGGWRRGSSPRATARG